MAHRGGEPVSILTLGRSTDWRGEAVLRGVGDELMALAACRGMCNLAAAHYLSADWKLCVVALHESGHAQVARALGCSSSISIDHHPAGMDAKCVFWGAPVESRRVRRLVALAGQVAEHVGVYGYFYGDAAVQQDIAFGVRSNKDRILSDGFTRADVSECYALVRQSWPEVIGQARELLAAEAAKWGAVE